jgi:hypothetical protein
MLLRYVTNIEAYRQTEQVNTAVTKKTMATGETRRDLTGEMETVLEREGLSLNERKNP